MREHKILIWCDVHAHRGESDAPATHTLMLGVSEIEATSTPGARVIDVCGECLAEVSGLVEVVEAQGVKPGDAPRPAANKSNAAPRYPRQHSTASGPCPICGESYGWLATHIVSFHQIDIQVATKVKGGKFACPECGETFAATGTLGRHANNEHGAPTAVLLARKTPAA